jgi:hypothetical protein
MDVYSLAKDEFTELVESDARIKKTLSDFIAQRAAAFAAAAEAAGLNEQAGS